MNLKNLYDGFIGCTIDFEKKNDPPYSLNFHWNLAQI